MGKPTALNPIQPGGKVVKELDDFLQELGALLGAPLLSDMASLVVLCGLDPKGFRV